MNKKLLALVAIFIASILYGTGTITGFTVFGSSASTGDFVQLDYVISLTDGTIVDTSIPEVGAEAGFINRTYSALLMNVVKPTKTTPTLNDALIGLSVGETKIIEVPAVEAFGFRNPSLVIPLNRTLFDAQNMTPQVGGRVVVQDAAGTIVEFDDSSVTIDFNNPFAGQDAIYEITIKKIWREI